MSNVDLELHSKPVRRRLTSQIYIRVSDETYNKILEIQEKIPEFKYSTYLRPMIEEEINRLHHAVTSDPNHIRKILKLIKKMTGG